MLRSLRFRLPAIFLLGVLVAALVTAAIAVRFFQEDTRARTLSELRRQAEGLAQLYTLQATTSIDEGLRAPRFAPPSLEEATGSRLYYAGVEIFPGSGVRVAEASDEPARPGGNGRRPGADLRLPAPGNGANVSRRRVPDPARGRDLRGDRRRQAASGAAGALDGSYEAAGARIPRRTGHRAPPASGISAGG